MIVPYSHRYALAQIPVPYRYKDTLLYIYPLRIRDMLEMDMWLQGNVVREYAEQAELLQQEEKEEFFKSVGDIVPNISAFSGVGRDFLWKSVPSMVHYAFLLLRGALSEDQISDLFFSSGFSRESASVIMEMSDAVYLELPKQEKLNVSEKKPRYLPTKEEDEARIYHFFATKFGWKYQDILDLTDYQIAWYSHLYPEDREHYEYLDSLSRKRNDLVDSLAADDDAENTPPGTIHFSSPEAYEEWKRQREQGKK